jgi:pyruvate kinase
MRHTKIVATVGPACNTDAVLAQLVTAGVDIFRLNFSHGSHESHAATVERIRRASQNAGRHVAILQDLSGPKIRTGRLTRGEAVPLVNGATLRIVTGDIVGDVDRVSTSYAELARSVKPGDRLLLDDGKLELRVESTDGREVVTTVVDGGPLGEHKGINAPGVRLPASSITKKDAEDLAFGLSKGVDIVALSFVQSVNDVMEGRRLLAQAGHPLTPVVAKIERPEALADIGRILDACDGVMVARGDLGLELPLEEVPRAQRIITREARMRGIPVIVATQVLESMRTEPRPTRAEVSDAANAVAAGVDAIMLSGETAVGAFPVRTVETLAAVIRVAEESPDLVVGPVVNPSVGPAGVQHSRALCDAAVVLARDGHAEAIVAVTRKGNTAKLLAALRPPVPIYAATGTPEVARRLALCRGVTAFQSDLGPELDATGIFIEQQLVAREVLKPGQNAVFINVNADPTRTDANFLSIRRVVVR